MEENKIMKLVYCKYDKKHNAVKERLITTKLITPSFAQKYINDNNKRTIMTYCPGLINTDHHFSMLLETTAYKKEYQKIKD